MHVELSPQAQERVESLVASGAYENVESVIDAALDELLIPARKFSPEELAQSFAKGRADIAAGRTRPAEGLVAELRAMVDAKAARSQR